MKTMRKQLGFTVTANSDKEGEGTVSSTTSTETVGAETGRVHHLNGASKPSSKKKEDKPNLENVTRIAADDDMEAELATAVIRVLKANGLHDLAEKMLKGDAKAKAEPGIVASVKRAAQHRITVGDIAIITIAAGVMFVAYEGLAYAFDWDFRYGLFGEKDAKTPMRKMA